MIKCVCAHTSSAGLRWITGILSAVCVRLNTKITSSQIDLAPGSERRWEARSDSLWFSLISDTSTASVNLKLRACVHCMSANIQYMCFCVFFIIYTVCACFCVWSRLAGVFLEGNKSICYKKTACDLTPGPCCSLPLSARRARDIARLRKRERTKMGWWAERWTGEEQRGGSERCQDRGR